MKTSVTFLIQTLIIHEENDYEDKINKLITRLESYGFDVNIENETDEE